MKTDKELLELASKAAQSVNKNILTIGCPLTDDGDALRLAVILKLCIDMNWMSIGSAGDTMCFMPDNQSIMQSHNGDPYEATRRVIVRAAAAIGERL